MKSINNNNEKGSKILSKSDYNVLEIFHALIQIHNTNDRKRLSLLNSTTKLLTNASNVLTTEEFLYCLSSNFVHQLTQVRAGALRVTRYLLKTTHDLQTFNSLKLDLLVCRSLDILLKNEEERIQALKLIRKMIMILPDLVSPALVRCLVALVDTSMVENTKPDRIVRACLATLSELGVLNPRLLIVCNGVSVLTRNVLECDSPRIAESLVGVLLHLLEYPQTRNIAGVSLDCLAAPYCDFTYRLGIMDKNKDARDLRFKCSRLALLSVLRSWTGALEFCNPSKASGLKAIIDILYLNQLEVRKAILDLLYELLGLPQPAWTDEYSVALAAVDPSDYQDEWRLAEGFVAMEGRSVLPSLANKVPNICEIHQAFLVYCFIENGLLNALVEVIVSSDTFISVRATILLAKLLQLIHTMLPADICSTSPSLPTLVSKATGGNHQAKAAISALQMYHQMLRNRPATCSLYLDVIIQNGELIKTRLFKREIDAQKSLSKSASLSLFERIRTDSIGSNDASGTFWDYWDVLRDTNSLGNESGTMKDRSKRSKVIRQKVLGFFEKFRENERLIKESMVLTHVDPKMWDWDIVVTIFKNKSLSTKLDENQLKFIKTLTHYFKPSSNKFSHMELGLGRLLPSNVNVGIELIDYLLEQIDELEYMRILTDWCSDISIHLQAICKKKPHDCLFSPSHMNNTMCQQYFLFIGRICRSVKGVTILKNTDILKHLMYLVANTNHTIYVKLIVSGLDYSLTSSIHYPRLILEKALTSSPSHSSRLYATQFLLVLLRARLPTVEEWGILLLMKQLNDKDRAIVLTALEILDEACHENIYLLELAHVWPDLSKHHELGKYIMMRFYSVPRGMNHPSANVKSEIDLWVNVFNKKYVLYVESETHSSLTLHTKNEEGFYSTRNSSLNQRQIITSKNLPCHLYGALAQTIRGIGYLQKHGNVSQLLDILSSARCGNEEECLNLKSALWALGHVATNLDGVEFLNDTSSHVFEKIIRLTKYCEVYSIRSTAFNVLNLIGSTVAGANALFKLDWASVRHDRNNEFPILEPEDWHLKYPSPVRYNHDVPAYNYGAINENLSNLTSTSLNPSFYVADASDATTLKDDSIHDGDMSTSTQRSRTLPAGTLPSQMQQQRSGAKHIRSLSESKTSDGLSGMVINRTRFNSGDSNTSGVSSCDSVNMRAVINERFRRVSLTGTPIRDTSQLTDQDVHGYKKLRQIRRNLRPMLSESAADDLADIYENEGNGRSAVRTLLPSFSLDSKRRNILSRNIERQSVNISGIDDIQKNIYVAKLLTQVDTKGPCYRGICLPRNILDLFPETSHSGTYVSRFIQEFDNLELNLSASSILTKNQYLHDRDITGAPDESAVSSMSDLSTGNKRTRKKTITTSIFDSANLVTETTFAVGSTSSGGTNQKHNKSECLMCCRTQVINKIIDTTSLNIQESKDATTTIATNLNGKTRDPDVSLYSPESIISDDSANTNMPDRITSTILRNVIKMANPIMFKACRKILMELKQKYPQSFQDICLYSDICKHMSKCSYRLTVRRFIQEIFLDLNYDAFSNGVDLVLEVAQQRLTDLKLLNNSKLFPLSSPPSSSQSHHTSNVPLSSIPIPIAPHKIHSLKSPLLASVYETSVENLMDSPPQITKDEVDAIVTLRSSDRKDDSMSKSTTQVTAEVHPHRYSFESSVVEPHEPIRRRRFKTLDLSCTKNIFPIKHRLEPSSSSSLSSAPSGPLATSTLRRPISLNTGTTSTATAANTSSSRDGQKMLYKSVISTSDHSFDVTSSRSPISPTLGTLFCEQRLLQSSRSEATLTNKSKNSKKTSDNVTSDK
ncbi:CLUMA_CG006294, isoform A [Clunio marinus]|uniref:CLUMA_CG006294, isoform A n=1 Tax=Clunio marinus TaxID=568069 RepID=A0A1J1HXI8_9DIPT|nr:CLUMA_CG006294, isoform A [Clunio marinus]